MGSIRHSTAPVTSVSANPEMTAAVWRARIGGLLALVLVLFGTVVWPGGEPSTASSTPAIVPLVPARLLETRSGPGLTTIDGAGLGAGKLVGGSTIPVKVAGRHGIPISAKAVMLNVTAVFPSGPGFLTVFPCGADRPGTSSVNYQAGQVVANAALAKLGTGGEVCVYTLTATDIVVDVTAYVPDGGSVNPIVPGRLLETRTGPDAKTIDGQGLTGQRVAANSVVEVKVTDRHGIPGDASSVMLNITAVFPDGPGFLTAFPCGQDRPTTSTVNYGAGQVVANTALAKVGAGGKVCIYSLVASDVLADITGYAPNGSTLFTLTPGRLLDTRSGPDAPTVDGQDKGGGLVGAEQTVTVKVTGRHGIPDDATAVMLNVTAVFPDRPGFLTVYPCGEARPTTSTVNYGPGQVVPNAALAKVGADGKVCIYSLGATHVIADVSGFVPGPSGQGPTTTLPGGGTTTTQPGGGTTTTVPQAGGLGTFLNVGFFGQQLAAGPDGRMHLAFEDGAAQRAKYGSCTANCDDANNWNVVELLNVATLANNITIGTSGLGVDDTGRVHLLMEGVESPGGGGVELMYATCAANCSQKASWTFTDLSGLADGSTTISTNKTFMVQPSGKVSFLTSGPGNYYECSAACSNGSNWTLGGIFGYDWRPLNAVVDGDGVTHAFVNAGDDANGNTRLQYARCEADCTLDTKWLLSELGFLKRTDLYTVTMDISSSGRLYLGYQQGYLLPADPNDGRYQVNSCDTAEINVDCFDLNAWSSFTIGAVNEGDDGGFIYTAGDAVYLATVDERNINLWSCTSNCSVVGSWTGPEVLDTNDSINAAVDPSIGSGCQGVAESATFWPKRPVIAVGTQGLVMVHNPSPLVKCSFHPFPGQGPTIGRVFSDF